MSSSTRRRSGSLATYDDPRRFPAGIPYVLVNGQLVIDGGEHTGALPGRALRRGRSGLMERPVLSRVERPVSRIVLGQSAPPEDLPALYDRFVELGGNAFETARWYPTEPALGRWLAGRADRAELFVITKGCHPAIQDGPPRVSPEAIRTDLTESLERLGLDRVDLFLLHRDDEAVPVGEIMTALAEHRAAGRIGAAGGSNWTTARLAEANAWAVAHGLPPFDVASPNLALAHATRPPWDGCVVAGDPASLAWYTASQLPLLAWSALARAYFVEGSAGTAQATAFGADARAVDVAATAAFDSPGIVGDGSVPGPSAASSG